MLQKLSLFSLLLGALMVLGISSCSKPLSDAQARERIIGAWAPILGNVHITFEGDGKVCFSGDVSSCGTYTITKDKITIVRDTSSGSEAVSQNGITIFAAGQASVEIPIIDFKKKTLVVRLDGRRITFHKE